MKIRNGVKYIDKFNFLIAYLNARTEDFKLKLASDLPV